MYKNFEEFWADKRIKKLAIDKLTCMKQRCYNPNNPAYPSYGARGITVCKEWLEDSFKFYKWLYKNKYYSSKEFESIDRIDSSKGYSPENCRLVSKEFNTRYINGVVQKKYKYSNTNLYYKAKKQIPFETIKSRNKLGWKQEDIISRPVEKHSITIGIIRNAVNYNWNQRSFVEHLIRFRNDNHMRFDLYREVFELIKEYKSFNRKKKGKTDYLVKRSIVND